MTGVLMLAISFLTLLATIGPFLLRDEDTAAIVRTLLAITAAVSLDSAFIYAAAVRGISSHASILFTLVGVLIWPLVLRVSWQKPNFHLVELKHKRRRVEFDLPQVFGHSPGRRVFVASLTFVFFVGLLIPLRYSGALAGDRTMTAIAKIASIGMFVPLRELRGISKGQCIEGHLPKAENIVVPCNQPHRSEVTDAVDVNADCPNSHAMPYEHDGLVIQDGELKLNGIRYCWVQSTSATRYWFGSALLPPTS